MNRREFLATTAAAAIVPHTPVAEALHGPIREMDYQGFDPNRDWVLELHDLHTGSEIGTGGRFTVSTVAFDRGGNSSMQTEMIEIKPPPCIRFYPTDAT